MQSIALWVHGRSMEILLFYLLVLDSILLPYTIFVDQQKLNYIREVPKFAEKLYVYTWCRCDFSNISSHLSLRKASSGGQIFDKDYFDKCLHIKARNENSDFNISIMDT